MSHTSPYDESFINTDSVGGALSRALQGMGGEPVGLREHVGKGLSVLHLGMDRLRRRGRTLELSEPTIENATTNVVAEYYKGEALCESPIERAMLAALLTAHWAGFQTIPPRIHNGLDKAEMMPEGDVIIVPQMAFMRYRLDFGVVLRIQGRAPQIVAVECDGADFHNDYKREHLRVKYLNSWGIPVFKFKGSEIHSDPLAAADKVSYGVAEWRALL